MQSISAVVGAGFRVPAMRTAAVGALLLATACAESPVGVAPEDPAPEAGLSTSSTTSPIDIWWPKDGSWLDGTHRFQALLQGRSVDSYRMYWEVDGDQLRGMYDSYATWPHKEAVVDVSGWNWRGSGPYRITFVAKDLSGNTIATRTTSIYVGSPPPPPPAGNPFAGAKLWVDPYSAAQRQVDAWRDSRPADADLLERIARRPQAIWLGEWIADVGGAVDHWTTTITAAGALPVFVAYNIPQRDCGFYSAGGASSHDAYRTWIRAVADGIGSRKAVVILEPDALGLLTDCLTPTDQRLRLDLIAEAVRTLRSKSGIAVYVDAGNSGWQSPEVMAARLKEAGIANANGFSLNISNFHTTSDNLAYGERVSALVGGKHFVIDTSRNGIGPTEVYEWCNPDGRALGHPPTTSTGHPLADAFLWIKRPGESDGECNGGPAAGAWWADYALGLAQRMPVTLALLP